MAYINDRRRVETLIAPISMCEVILSRGDRADPEVQHCALLLTKEIDNLTADIPAASRPKIMRRAYAAFTDAIVPYTKEGMLTAKVVLIIYYIVNGLAEAEYLAYPEDGEFFRAMMMILPEFEADAGNRRIDESSQKHARKALTVLQGLGYFQGVSI